MRKQLFLALLILALAAQGASARSTTQYMDVEEGTRLVVEHGSGTLLVEGWSENRVSVDAHHEEDTEVEVRLRGQRLIVSVRGEHKFPEELDLEIRVPQWMIVLVEGREVDTEIVGVLAPISVRLLGGKVFVRGGRGAIDVRNVHGRITLREAEGEIDLESTNEDIKVRDCTGTLIAESVHGDIRMDAVDMKEIELITTNGDIIYDGTIRPEGNYFMSTHDGEIHVSLPRDADVAIEVLTYQGEVHLPDIVTGRRMRFDRERRLREWELGEGRARMRVESFSGDVSFYDPKQGRGKHDR